MIRFTKAKMLQKAKPRSRGDKKTALDKLYSYLNAAEPEAIEFLVSFWNTQAQGVTYAELREAYLAGEITPQLYQRWTEDYSRFIQDRLAPLWDQAAQAGAAEVSAKYPKFVYEPSISAAIGFIKEHGAELVTNITEEQRKALNAVVSHISGYTAITPDEAARMIRPTVGLTVGQTLANVRHCAAVEEAYLKAHPRCDPETAKRKAAESAARYAGRQHRYRAQNIARTELAFAYNAGHYGATRDAQEQGYIGDCTKTYLTADDERVCPICGALDGEKRNMSEPFSFGKLLPPAHPSCRCAVAYEEILPDTRMIEADSPALTDSENDDTIVTQNPWGFQMISDEHDIDDDVRATNPNYFTGTEWQVNCQRCVSAYEARRRGFAVSAKPAIMDGTDTLPYMMHSRGWPNVYAEGASYLETPQGKTGSTVLKSILSRMKDYGDGARAIVRVRWQSGGGHVFIAEQVGGITRFVDPQPGELDASYYFSKGMIKPTETRLLRIDDKDFTDLIKECVE